MSSSPTKPDFAQSFEELDHRDLLARAVEEAQRAATFKELYQELLERYRQLERGRTTESERLTDDQRQLTLDLLGEMLPPQEEHDELASTEVKGHKRKKRGKRKPLPEHLPVVKSVLVPDEVLEEGLEHFEVVGAETSRTVERQPSLLYVHEVVRPKLLRKDRERSADALVERALAGKAGADFIVAEPPTHPIPKSIVGVGFLAQTIVMRWEDHLPLHRQQNIFGREGLTVHKSTICGWHTAAAELLRPLVESMWSDARASPILYADATSVRMRAKKKCKRQHIWTVIAPEKHILFAHTRKHDKKAVDEVLGGFSGYLVADAATVYDHLYESDITECNCWAHARRYFHRALESQPEEALRALRYINELFVLERRFKDQSAEQKLKARQQMCAPVVKDYFEWCDNQSSFEGTPLHAALTYSKNQRKGLERFLECGRVPIHNNASELALRRQAVGRKNWLFLGNERGANNNVTLVSLLASCALHGLNPVDYLRDLFCLLADWPLASLLELAPLHWKTTRERPDVVNMLARNPHWRAATIDVTKQFPERTEQD